MIRSGWAVFAVLLIAVALVGCGKPADAEPFANLPAAPELPEGGVLYYWVVEGDPPTVDEVIVLHGDGTITYEDRLAGKAGEQFLGPGGVEQLLADLQRAGFWDLQGVHRPRKGDSSAQRYIGLAARADKGSHVVQWQEPAIPSALSDVAADLAQFAQVVKMTIR